MLGRGETLDISEVPAVLVPEDRRESGRVPGEDAMRGSAQPT